MGINELIIALKNNSGIFIELFKSFPEEFIKWKPSPDKWSLLEIINHLYDEEQFDFRARCSRILEGSTEWDAIDPVGWVMDKKYIDKDFDSSVRNFLSERDVSVEWLKNNKSRDWNVSVTHHRIGNISALNMLNNWLAHDILHMRQILNLRWIIIGRNYDLRYAGDW